MNNESSYASLFLDGTPGIFSENSTKLHQSLNSHHSYHSSPPDALSGVAGLSNALVSLALLLVVSLMTLSLCLSLSLSVSSLSLSISLSLSLSLSASLFLYVSLSPLVCTRRRDGTSEPLLGTVFAHPP
jgi:hypothetical protein